MYHHTLYQMYQSMRPNERRNFFQAYANRRICIVDASATIQATKDQSVRRLFMEAPNDVLFVSSVANYRQMRHAVDRLGLHIQQIDVPVVDEDLWQVAAMNPDKRGKIADFEDLTLVELARYLPHAFSLITRDRDFFRGLFHVVATAGRRNPCYFINVDNVAAVGAEPYLQ